MYSENEYDNKPLTFGKYKGKTPKEISDHDPGYIVWLYDTILPKKCSKELRNACEKYKQQRKYDNIDEYSLDDDWGDRS